MSKGDENDGSVGSSGGSGGVVSGSDNSKYYNGKHGMKIFH